jgi:hypothetical protein
MQFTLQKAAEATGKAKSTIQRAIKTGRLSATLNSKGTYSIDVAELSRVYPLRQPRSKPVSTKQVATDERNNEMELLRVKIELLQMQLEQSKETTIDLRKRLDASDAERRQLLNLLQNHSSNDTPTKPKSWLNRLFDK